MGKSVRNAESSRNKKETKEKNIKREREREREVLKVKVWYCKIGIIYIC